MSKVYLFVDASSFLVAVVFAVVAAFVAVVVAFAVAAALVVELIAAVFWSACLAFRLVPEVVELVADVEEAPFVAVVASSREASSFAVDLLVLCVEVAYHLPFLPYRRPLGTATTTFEVVVVVVVEIEGDDD